MTDDIEQLKKDAGWTQARFDSVLKFHGGNREEAIKSLRAAAEFWKGNPDAGKPE